MKIPSRRPPSLLFLIACGPFLATDHLHAADGTWNANSDGNWSDTTKWQDLDMDTTGDVADGADSTALFDNVITANRIVTLDSARTIGNIIAADTSHDYTISGANILTLDRTDATKPTIHIPTSSRTLMIGSVVDGSDGLMKTGAGNLNLTATNTYGGGTIVNGGTITVGVTNSSGSGSNSLGTGTVTVTSNSTIQGQYGSYPVIVNALQVDPGVTLTTLGSTQYFGMGFSGVVSGSGTIKTGSSGNNANGSGNKLDLKSDANTFTGTLRNEGGSAIIGVNSLGDGGKIQLLANSNDTGGFALNSGTASPLVFGSRQIELFGNSAIYNNNGTASNTITITTDLACGSTGNKTLSLRGSNTGNNTYGGNIGDGNFSAATQVISLKKYDGGRWILTGPNTYTGDTTIIDGTLEIRGAGQLGAGGVYPGNITSTDTTPSPFTFDSSANTTISGTISGGMALIKDGAGTLSLTNANTYTGSTTVSAGTLSLGDGSNNSSLNDFSTLSVASGAVLNLNYSGSDTVFFLNLGGSPAAAGKWGRTGSIAGLGADFESALITGDGLINNVAGITTSFGIAYWDGGSGDIVGDGNAVSAGGAGTWNTTAQNWDVGATAHTAWLNTSTAKAVFGGTENANRTVTVAEPLNIKELSFETTGSAGTRYIIDGGTLNFGAGGMIRTADNRYDQTITSTITGSPAVETRDNGAGNTYLGLKFAPTTGNTQTLGAVLNPNNTGTTDKAGVTFAGSTTGNTIVSINYVGGDQYADTNFQGGEWTVSGTVATGSLRISGGRAIINGNTTLTYNGLVMSGTGVLGGTTTIFKNDRRSTNNFPSGTGIAPGNGVGTLTFDWGTAGSPTTAQWTTSFRTGSSYEWQVGASATDIVRVEDGNLIVEGFTLKIIDAGGTPANGSVPLTVFEYGTLNSKTLSLGTVVFDTSDLVGKGWTIGTLALTDDTDNKRIVLTGLSKTAGPSTPYDTWMAGFDFSGYTNPDLTASGNPDSDGFDNLQEFAFGFNPAVPDGGGTLTIDGGGAITQNGLPQIYEDPNTHQFFLRYTRRADHVAAGLTYTAQFAPGDLAAFEDVAGGSVVATGTGAGGVAIEAVAIEFSDALPISGRKARFGKVTVAKAP